MSDDPTKPLVISTTDIKPIVEMQRNPGGGRHFGLDAETAKYRETLKPITKDEKKD